MGFSGGETEVEWPLLCPGVRSRSKGLAVLRFFFLQRRADIPPTALRE